MKHKYFKVEGAGEIQVGESTNTITAQVAGFHFGVSWSRFPYIGGVLSRTEAKKLADFINEQLNKCEDTEKEAVAKAYMAMK